MQPTARPLDRLTARPADRLTARPVNRTTGFTLVEMLVVVLIIAVLIGLTVKILGGAGRQAAKAVTVNHLERLKHAVEEFYSEYGQYPPVNADGRYGSGQPVAYEYPLTNDFASAAGQFIPGGGGPGAQWGEAPLFTFGLMGYLVPRINHDVGEIRDHIAPDIFLNDQWALYNETASDLARFEAARQRWRPFLEGPPDSILDGNAHTNVVRAISYWLGSTTVCDGWGRELMYESKPPYQTYKLWSRGPNGVTETNPPSDDIYGHVGQ